MLWSIGFVKQSNAHLMSVAKTMAVRREKLARWFIYKCVTGDLQKTQGNGWDMFKSGAVFRKLNVGVNIESGPIFAMTLLVFILNIAHWLINEVFDWYVMALWEPYYSICSTTH